MKEVKSLKQLVTPNLNTLGMNSSYTVLMPLDELGKDVYCVSKNQEYGNMGALGWGLLNSSHKISELKEFCKLWPSQCPLIDQGKNCIILWEELLSVTYTKVEYREALIDCFVEYFTHGLERAKKTEYMSLSLEQKASDCVFVEKKEVVFLDKIQDIYNFLINTNIEDKHPHNVYCYSDETKRFLYINKDYQFVPLITELITVVPKDKVDDYYYEFYDTEGTYGNCNVYAKNYITQSDFNLLYNLYHLDKEQQGVLYFPPYCYENFKVLEEKNTIKAVVNNTLSNNGNLLKL